MRIIGITGTLGAGKGAVVEYLKQKGFSHFSVREFLIQRLKERGLPVNRDTMTELANELRKEHGPAYIIEELYKEAKKEGKNAIIESIRATGEEEALRKLGDFFLIAVDAVPELRYARAILRGSETDKISYERFMADEEREMNSTDPFKQNIAAVMARADARVDNSGTFEALHEKLDALIEVGEGL